NGGMQAVIDKASYDYGYYALGGGAETGLAIGLGGLLGPEAAVAPDVAASDRMAAMLRDGIPDGEDCSEIACDLLNAADGRGSILRVEPPRGQRLTIMESEGPTSVVYHEVYSDGRFVFDPRRST